MVQSQEKVSLGQRWSKMQPTKTVLFWSCVACVVLTMIVGFTWGGWMTGGSAQKMAEEMAEDAVVNRLAPMCVVRFNEDPEKDQKLKELKEAGAWKGGDYVKEQGWATLPGEEKPDTKVAKECAKQLMQISE